MDNEQPDPNVAAWQQGSLWSPQPEGYNECYNLGSAKHMQWSLIDDAHPSDGVMLSYLGESFCFST